MARRGPPVEAPPTFPSPGGKLGQRLRLHVTSAHTFERDFPQRDLPLHHSKACPTSPLWGGLYETPDSSFWPAPHPVTCRLSPSLYLWRQENMSGPRKKNKNSRASRRPGSSDTIKSIRAHGNSHCWHGNFFFSWGCSCDRWKGGPFCCLSPLRGRSHSIFRCLRGSPQSRSC